MEDPGDVFERADHVEPPDLVDTAAGLVVDGAEELETPFGMLVDPLDELGGPLSRSHDQHATGVKTLATDIMRAHENDRLLEPDEEEAQGHEEQEELPAHEGQLEQEDEGAQEKKGHDGGFDHRPEDLEVRARPRRLIHAVRIKGHAPVGNGNDQCQPVVSEEGRGHRIGGGETRRRTGRPGR